MGQCYGFGIWIKDLTEEERQYLDELSRESAQFTQRFDLVNDLEKIFEFQQYLKGIRESLNEKFANRETWNEPHYV